MCLLVGRSKHNCFLKTELINRRLDLLCTEHTHFAQELFLTMYIIYTSRELKFITYIHTYILSLNLHSLLTIY